MFKILLITTKLKPDVLDVDYKVTKLHVKEKICQCEKNDYNGQKNNFWYKNTNSKNNSYCHQFDKNYGKSSYRLNQPSSYNNDEHESKHPVHKRKPVSFVSTCINKDQQEDLNSKTYSRRILKIFCCRLSSYMYS